MQQIANSLATQPRWSDLPILVTTAGGDLTERGRARLALLEPLGAITLLERPLRTTTLVSTIRAALRARCRQYELRNYLIERDRILKELERSNQELAQFAHVVSHDLQAPVRTAKNFSQLLAQRYRQRLDAEGEEYVDHIYKASVTMEELIRTLLHYAVVGQEPIAKKTFSLESLVSGVLFDFGSDITKLRAKVVCSELPIVYGDRVLLEQVIQNLVGNALKYRKPTEPPHVRICADREESAWMVCVTDNGLGIAPEYHERVFAPFKRLHGQEIPGTGIGLAVCKRIVERHGGRIWVESERGKGATFRFTLPFG